VKQNLTYKCASIGLSLGSQMRKDKTCVQNYFQPGKERENLCWHASLVYLLSLGKSFSETVILKW